MVLLGLLALLSQQGPDTTTITNASELMRGNHRALKIRRKTLTDCFCARPYMTPGARPRIILLLVAPVARRCQRAESTDGEAGAGRVLPFTGGSLSAPAEVPRGDAFTGGRCIYPGMMNLSRDEGSPPCAGWQQLAPISGAEPQPALPGQLGEKKG